MAKAYSPGLTTAQPRRVERQRRGGGWQQGGAGRQRTIGSWVEALELYPEMEAVTA